MHIEPSVIILNCTYDAASIVCQSLRPGVVQPGKAVQVAPIKPTLKAPGTQRVETEI